MQWLREIRAPYYFLLYYFAAIIVWILSPYVCVCVRVRPGNAHWTAQCGDAAKRIRESLVSGECLPPMPHCVMQKSLPRLTLSGFPPQTVLLSVLMFQLFRTVGLRAFSMASETYMSGTHSAAFITCPNDTVAKDLARCDSQIERKQAN